MEASGQLHASAVYPRAENLQYPMIRMLSGPQSRSGRGGEERKNSSSCRVSNNGRPARSIVTILSELPQLLHSRLTIFFRKKCSYYDSRVLNYTLNNDELQKCCRLNMRPLINYIYIFLSLCF